MIRGRVTPQLESVVTVRVLGRDGAAANVDAVVDTGFDGFLSLTHGAIRLLELRQVGVRDGTLADGTVVSFPAFLATVDWHGAVRTGAVIQSGGGNLIGMKLLEGSIVRIHVVPSGVVEIEQRGTN
jgi:clan AA aspartic protease